MKKEKKQKVQRVINIILFFLFLILIYFSIFVNKKFNNISFEQLLYNVVNTEGANYDIVLTGSIFVFMRVLLIVLILYVFYKLYKLININIYFKVSINNKIFNFNILKSTLVKETIITLIFVIFSLFYINKMLNIVEFIKCQISSSEIFEEYYVDGKDIEIKFPDKKRNLIYIYAESMEATNFSKENGGLIEESYIPNLEKLALNNISFSNTDKLGGALPINNTTWTIAGLIAHTAGVPLKLSIDGNEYDGYGKSVPGTYTLGDILSDNGYNNYFLIGSDARFGGRKNYFENHGSYTIYDYYYAIENKYIEDDYHVWWGYEDKKLFKYAKEKILEAADKDEPFNFTLLTVDTHFTDGYMDSSCENVFDTKYANSLYCSDQKIYSFVKWIQKQDFYDNTTIIISGDHLTMQDNFYEENDEYQRTIYNTFINSSVEPKNEKNRLYSSFDMFPTTLAALGVEIENNKLGLGVNLFSSEETLIEKLGYEYLNNEIIKKSFYYDNKILGDTYYKMKEKVEK